MWKHAYMDISKLGIIFNVYRIYSQYIFDKIRIYLNIGLCKVRNVTGKGQKWVHDYMFLISQCVPYDYASCVSNASSNYSGKIITQ